MSPILASDRSPSILIASLLIVISPPLAGSNPAIILIKVVFPIPDGPTILRTSPSCTVRFRFLKMTFWSYILVKFLMVNIGLPPSI